MLIQVARWRTAPLLVEGFDTPEQIGNTLTNPTLMNNWEQMVRTLHVSMVSGGLIDQAYVNNFPDIYKKMIYEAGYRYQIDRVTLPTTITRGAGFTLAGGGPTEPADDPEAPSRVRWLAVPSLVA